MIRTDAKTSGRSGGTDFFKFGEQPTPAGYAVWERVCRFVDDEVLPVVNDYWERAEFPQAADRAPAAQWRQRRGRWYLGDRRIAGGPEGGRSLSHGRPRGYGETPHAAAGTAWSLISRGTPAARPALVAVAWQSPGSRPS